MVGKFHVDQSFPNFLTYMNRKILLVGHARSGGYGMEYPE